MKVKDAKELIELIMSSVREDKRYMVECEQTEHVRGYLHAIRDFESYLNILYRGMQI